MILMWLVHVEHIWIMVPRGRGDGGGQNSSSYRMTTSPFLTCTTNSSLNPSFLLNKGRGWSSLLPCLWSFYTMSSKFSPHLVLILCVSAFIISTWGRGLFLFVLNPRNAYHCTWHIGGSNKCWLNWLTGGFQRKEESESAEVPRKGFPEERLPQTNRGEGKCIPDWAKGIHQGTKGRQAHFY